MLRERPRSGLVRVYVGLSIVALLGLSFGVNYEYDVSRSFIVSIGCVSGRRSPGAVDRLDPRGFRGRHGLQFELCVRRRPFWR